MVSPSLLCLLAGAIPVFSAALKPLIAHDVRYVGEPERRHLDIGEFSNLEGRNTNLGTFNLAKTFPANDVLIQVALGKSSGATSGSLSLTATCVDCHTTGSAVVTTSGVKTDDGILGDIIDFIKSSDKTDLVAKALGMDLVVELDNFGGHFEFDISFAASGTYTVTLFKSETPVGVELDDSNKIGLLFTIELTLTVSDSVDFTTGFDLSFPKGASFTLNPINGDLVSMNIGGAQVNSIPVKFKKGAACIAAVLRLKFQAGVALKVFNTGFDFESGVFFDPLQYKACITYQPSQPCALQFTENFYEEIGAYARAVGDLDFAKLSVGPTAVSTFFTGALPSQCLSTASSSASSKTVISTTAPPVKQTSSAEAGTSSKAGTTTGKTVSGGKNSTATEPKPGSTSTKKVLTTSTAGSSANATTTTGKTDGITASGKPSGTILSGGYGSKPTGISTGVSKFGTGSAGNVYTQPTGPAPYGNSSASSTQSFATVVTLPTSLQTSLPASSLKTDGVVNGGASTTDTITFTSVYTITSCKPEVTNCPARIGQVTSEVITTTTVCPVSGASSTAAVVSSPAVSSPAPTGTDLTTRTIFSTSTYTITSCLSNVLHCPASLTSDVVQTKTIVAYTTVCPVSQTDFPSALPSSAASSAAASQIATAGAILTTAAPSYSINPVPLTPCETPIVKTFDTYAPLPTITMNITATAPYPLMNSTLRSFPTASGVASNSIVAPITKTVIPIPLFTGSASAAPVASASPIGYSKVNGYNGIKAQAETSGGVTLPSASPVSKQTSGAESVSPRGLMILGASVVGLFALL